MSDIDVQDATIDEPNYSVVYTPRAKELRDKFVRQYLIDYDQTAAALRVGYPKSIADTYGKLFMDEPYVAQQIRIVDGNQEEDTPESRRKMIIAGLRREANYRGPGCSQAARVAAFSRLAIIEGIDAPTRTKTELTGADGQPLNAGGFIVIPGIITEEEWEAKAAEQQAKLVAQPPPRSGSIG